MDLNLFELPNGRSTNDHIKALFYMPAFRYQITESIGRLREYRRIFRENLTVYGRFFTIYSEMRHLYKNSN